MSCQNVGAIITDGRHFFRAILFVALLLVFASSEIEAQILSRDVECRGNVTTFLNKYYPNYEILTINDLDSDAKEYFLAAFGADANPGCVREDFDGDGLVDYALLLINKKKRPFIEKVVVFKGRSPNHFTPILLDELVDRAGSYFINRVPPGKIKKWEETEYEKMESVVMTRPGFELVLFEAASRVYYWNGKEFRGVQTSD